MDDRGRDLAARLAAQTNFGVHFTSPAEVFDDYSELSDALDTLGRPDLAEALNARVSSRLCAQHAALLRVLLLCRREVMQARTPAKCIANETSTDILSEIAAETPDFSMYTNGDTSASDEDVNCDETNEISNETNEISNESKTKVHRGPSQTQETPLTSRAAQISRQYRIASELAEPPPRLSYSQALRELSLLVSQRPCFQNTSLSGFSAECSQSVWDQFDKLSQFPARVTEIWSCTTIIELLATLESQLLAVPVSNADLLPTTLNLAVDRCDLVKSAADFRQCGFTERISEDLEKAWVYARLARTVYHSKLPSFPLPRPAQVLGSWIQPQVLRCGSSLLNAGLRADLLAAWDQLSAVFLVQNDRTLLLLNYWSTKRFNSSLAELNAYTNSVWPNAPFVFGGAPPRPQVSLPMHAQLAAAFGPNFSQLFHQTALHAAWQYAVQAMQAGHQPAEFDLREASLRVKRQIRTSLVVQPYFTTIM